MSEGQSGIPTPAGYSPLAEASVAAYCCRSDELRGVLGLAGAGPEEAARQLDVQEVGDGNLNFVYIVRAPGGRACVVKQALPYVRCVGESWQLTLERASFEHSALREHGRLAPGGVPDVFLFDSTNALIAMRFLAPPHKIMRKHLIEGARLPRAARDLASFCAKTLFGSSALALPAKDLRARVAEWSRNSEMCALTENVVFTEPYWAAPLNRHTDPELDGYAASVRGDCALACAAALLKGRFLGCPQALIHGDLHTGSVMAHEGSTVVIDPEFACYGPMGFDTGSLVANLLLAFFAQRGHRGGGGARGYQEWVLQQIVDFYVHFEAEFLRLWNSSVQKGVGGEAYCATIFPAGSAALAQVQRGCMRELFRDAVGFAGVEIIRRVLGLAHVADLEEISSTGVRSGCEKRALLLARVLVLQGAGSESGGEGGGVVGCMEDLVELAWRAEGVPDGELGDALFAL